MERLKMPKTGAYRRIRKEMYDKQKGLCIYCKCEMVLVLEYNDNNKPLRNMVTLEHLIDRLDPRRFNNGWYSSLSNNEKYAAACCSCNHKRGKQREIEFQKNMNNDKDKIKRKLVKYYGVIETGPTPVFKQRTHASTVLANRPWLTIG